MKCIDTKRVLSWVLMFFMLITAIVPAYASVPLTANTAGYSAASNARADGDTVYVLAGGDFQAGDNGQADHYYSRINMGNILDKIKEKYSTMNGFIFVGDYDGDSHDDSNAATGVAAMMEEVSERFDT